MKSADVVGKFAVARVNYILVSIDDAAKADAVEQLASQ